MKAGCQGFCHILSSYRLYSSYGVLLQRKRASGTILWDILSLALHEHHSGYHHHGYQAPDHPSSERIGVQRAHYLTLMTKPIAVQEAQDWGLVDAHDPDSASLLHRHLLCLRRLSKPGIVRYKHYMHDLAEILRHAKPLALAANREVFSDPDNLKGMFRFVEQG